MKDTHTRWERFNDFLYRNLWCFRRYKIISKNTATMEVLPTRIHRFWTEKSLQRRHKVVLVREKNNYGEWIWYSPTAGVFFLPGSYSHTKLEKLHAKDVDIQSRAPHGLMGDPFEGILKLPLPAPKQEGPKGDAN